MAETLDSGDQLTMFDSKMNPLVESPATTSGSHDSMGFISANELMVPVTASVVLPVAVLMLVEACVSCKSRISEKDSSDMDLSSFVGALTNALQDTQVRACLSDIVGESFRQELISLKAELKKKDSVIKHLDRRIESLESQNDPLEQYTRRNSIRVTGLPEVEHEDILDRTLKIVNEDLEVNPPISIMDIDRVHRTTEYRHAKLFYNDTQ
ncbi:hypothetical protein CAPTEDRAFT_216920 [Capitella teleta]|uniref:Uncharacterized protein n=1 Tax=Capitella teleta TaxID=283909 RepID=R7VA33_CAPTE|nr:hypothetical protein CAPTEDRAFT_216920 [Capitella teleta]|eukprot:ELU13176.1 hypothetical protein CAPTEDRAFT_216920 [Capitella teleta]